MGDRITQVVGGYGIGGVADPGEEFVVRNGQVAALQGYVNSRFADL